MSLASVEPSNARPVTKAPLIGELAPDLKGVWGLLSDSFQILESNSQVMLNVWDKILFCSLRKASCFHNLQVKTVNHSNQCFVEVAVFFFRLRTAVYSFVKVLKLFCHSDVAQLSFPWVPFEWGEQIWERKNTYKKTTITTASIL